MSQLEDDERAYPKNVPGPFYVIDGCCMSCDVPIEIAPEHFEYDQQHCFVKRQPETPEELENVLKAVWGSEAFCIRYRGDDSEIRDRVNQANAVASS